MGVLITVKLVSAKDFFRMLVFYKKKFGRQALVFYDIDADVLFSVLSLLNKNVYVMPIWYVRGPLKKACVEKNVLFFDFMRNKIIISKKSHVWRGMMIPLIKVENQFEKYLGYTQKSEVPTINVSEIYDILNYAFFARDVLIFNGKKLLTGIFSYVFHRKEIPVFLANEFSIDRSKSFVIYEVKESINQESFVENLRRNVLRFIPIIHAIDVAMLINC